LPVDSRIAELSPYVGGYRATITYTLTDGRVIRRGPFTVVSQADADAKGLALESDVLAEAVSQDADVAVDGSLPSFGEADSNAVAVKKMEHGVNAERLYESYARMKDTAPVLLAIGLTDAQYAAQFGVTVEQVAGVKALWAYLDQNKTAIEAYQLVEDGWSG